MLTFSLPSVIQLKSCAEWRTEQIYRLHKELGMQLRNMVPRSIRVDQGSEFISRDLDLRAYQKGIVLDFSCLNKNGGLASGLQRGAAA